MNGALPRRTAPVLRFPTSTHPGDWLVAEAVAPIRTGETTSARGRIGICKRLADDPRRAASSRSGRKAAVTERRPLQACSYSAGMLAGECFHELGAHRMDDSFGDMGTLGVGAYRR